MPSYSHVFQASIRFVAKHTIVCAIAGVVLVAGTVTVAAQVLAPESYRLSTVFATQASSVSLSTHSQGKSQSTNISSSSIASTSSTFSSSVISSVTVASSQSAQSNTNQPTVPVATTKTYTNPRVPNFVITYPSDWSVSENITGIQVRKNDMVALVYTFEDPQVGGGSVACFEQSQIRVANSGSTRRAIMTGEDYWVYNLDKTLVQTGESGFESSRQEYVQLYPEHATENLVACGYSGPQANATPTAIGFAREPIAGLDLNLQDKLFVSISLHGAADAATLAQADRIVAATRY